MTSLNLYLLRHGETEFSKSGGFCGFLDADLSPEGHQMAGQFAEAYKDMDWQALYCSTLKRTIDTATPLSSAKGLELRKREGLKEIDYGSWEGLTHAFVKEKYAEDYSRWTAEPGWNAPTGGETAFQIAERAMNVVSEILNQYKSGNVLVVSHKATIRIILCSLLGIELGRYRDRINILSASLSCIKFNEHGPMLEIVNDRSYLSKDLRDRVGT